MGYHTFVDGVPLPSSDLMTYLMKQAVIVCTSGSRPGGGTPPEGMTIYETDTDRMLTYTTSTTGWVPAWNKPWGYVGSAQITSSFGSTITAVTDITGLSVTATAVANRRWKITARGQLSSTVSTDYGTIFITDAGGTAAHQCAAPLTSVADATATALVTTTAGSLTYKVRASRNGTGNMTFAAVATVPGFILIEDIGPSAAPA